MSVIDPGSNSSENVLILAPLGQDGELTSKVLKDAGIPSEVMKDIWQLCGRLETLAAALFLTEESLNTDGMGRLREMLSNQEEWSDLPIILVTSEKKRFEQTMKIVEYFGNLGNISILERPFSVVTLVTQVRVAIRARDKQYRMRELLRDLNRELQIRDEFLSVASHELKTPLTSLKLQIQMRRRALNREDAPQAMSKINHFLQAADNQIQRLTRLVEDMLDISRIENGKLSLNRSRCDLSEILIQVYEGFSAQLESLELEVKLQTEEGIEGYWDRYRIEQALINLTSNAIKYGNMKPIHMKAFKEDGFGVLEVKDHGPGISAKDRTRIFDRFERAVKIRNISGLGLGLFISKQIVEMHGGQLLLESQEGKGSIFRIKLPL